MEIKIQLADNVYKDLMSGGNRIQGNFNAHRRADYVRPETKFIKLAHGRASVTEERVSLTLRIDRKEADVVPCEVIEVESQAASDFVYSNS